VLLLEATAVQVIFMLVELVQQEQELLLVVAAVELVSQVQVQMHLVIKEQMADQAEAAAAADLVVQFLVQVVMALYFYIIKKGSI
jgi:hypothetical protein